MWNAGSKIEVDGIRTVAVDVMFVFFFLFVSGKCDVIRYSFLMTSNEGKILKCPVVILIHFPCISERVSRFSFFYPNTLHVLG